jgi:hypothetical protein
LQNQGNKEKKRDKRRDRKKGRNRITKGLHAIGTVTELIITLLIDGIRSMQNIHSQNQRQAVEIGVIVTRR